MVDGPGTQPTLLTPASAPGLHQSNGDLTIGDGAIAALSKTARRNIENLGQTVATTDQAAVASALDAGAAKVREAIQSPAFRAFLDRTITLSAAAKDAPARHIFPTQDHSAQLDRLVDVAMKITDAAVAEFTRQSAGAALKERTLQNSQVGLVTLVTPKISGTAVREFVDSIVEDQKTREVLVGIVRNGIRDAIGAALVTEGHTRREHLPSQRQLVNISALDLQFLGRPDGNDVHNKMDAARLAIAARNQNPERVRDFLLAIEDMPRMPMGKMHDELSLQMTRRMQRAVASLLSQHRDEPIGEAHFKTVAILSDIFKSGAILFHPYSHNNDVAVVDQIFRAAQRGSITLAAASCPNYSGKYGTDPKTNERRWEYDFQTLGTGPGFVAERGLDYVRVWHSVLTEHLGEGNVTFKHYQGTFEIAQGFKGSAPDFSGALPYDEAVRRLSASNVAVTQLYAERFGITVEPHLTNEVISDPQFIERKMHRAEEIRGQLSENAELQKLAESIGQSRLGLYLKWYPMKDGEDDPTYLARIAREVVPGNIAEYELLGEILRGSTNDTLVLAYDSPIMGEVYAMHGMPVISGQGATTAGYLGA